jgi:hypothetical protein
VKEVSLRLRTPRSLVWVTLLGFLWSTGLPLYESHGLVGADDAACITVPGSTGGTPTMAALVDTDQPTHCAVCHLLRAVNGSVAPAIVSFTVPVPQSVNSRLIVDLTFATEQSVRTSRAPPQTL